MFHNRFEGKTVLYVVVAVLAVTIAFGGIVASASAENATPDPKDQEITKLRAKLSALETENAMLIGKNRELTALNAKLTKAVKSYAAKVRALRARAWSLYRKLRAALRRLATMFGPWHSAKASWYGPGFYGHGLAGGGVLKPNMKIFAHRTMKFGTKVQFKYRGRCVVAVAKDRGPYIAGRTFDLGPGTAKALGFDGVGTVRWRVIR